MSSENRVYESVTDLIANVRNPTPMVKVGARVNPSKDFLIYIKLERYNPFGSVKDRIALGQRSRHSNRNSSSRKNTGRKEDYPEVVGRGCPMGSRRWIMPIVPK
ncbi:MAG: hypothetical protein ACYSTZ_07775 [Planctomycetota bacterium]